MIKIYLLIQAIIMAWMSADTMARMSHMGIEREAEWVELFDQLGKTTLTEQKQLTRKLSGLISLLYIAYGVFSLVYFWGSWIPIMATVLLMTVAAIDYLDGMKRMKEAQTISDFIAFTPLNKATTLASLGLIAAQVGFLV